MLYKPLDHSIHRYICTLNYLTETSMWDMQRSLGCETPDWDFPKKRHVERMPAGLVYQGEPWHAPPHWNDPNMMEGSDTFLVVRNPVRFSLILNVLSCSLYNRLTFCFLVISTV